MVWVLAKYLIPLEMHMVKQETVCNTADNSLAA